MKSLTTMMTMTMTTKRLLIASFSLIALGTASLSLAQDKPWQHIGRTATPAEVKAWDIDVRGDFKGLPVGRGSVAKGEGIWEDKCASCHGIFGESNEVFTPITGGFTSEDIKRGRVAALAEGGVPQRTTLMKLAKLSTIWDYINRAMPWDKPKSLSTDEVYAVVAYILNMGGIVKGDFELSNLNIASTQNLLPNRNGLMDFEGLWKTRGKPDVKNVACMTNCGEAPSITSSLPDFARNAHGNLAEQNRLVGPVRGADTTKPAPISLAMVAQAVHNADTSNMKAVATNASEVKTLLASNNCMACHTMKTKLVGPAFASIANKYKNIPDRQAHLTKKIRAGGAGVWGSIPMPPQTELSDTDLQKIVQWLADGAQ